MRILIVEDEPLIATDIELTLTEAGHTVVGITHTSVKAFDMIHSRKPDLVLLDIAIKGDKNGIDIGRFLHSELNIPFIYITSFADKNTLEEAKSTLPYGYIVKPFKDKDIVSAIEMAGFRYQTESKPVFPVKDELNNHLGTSLTQREFDVLEAMWQGSSNKEISDRLDLSINTIKTHSKNLFLKLNVSSRSEAIATIRKYI